MLGNDTVRGDSGNDLILSRRQHRLESGSGNEGLTGGDGDDDDCGNAFFDLGNGGTLTPVGISVEDVQADPTGSSKSSSASPVRRYASIRFATSSSITSVAPPPMAWMRASRAMRSMTLPRM